MVVGVGGFLTWAWLTPLDSAAVATGTVIVDSKRKTVSHLEGGILKTLLAQEGALVAAGQPILRLDDTRARGDLEQLRARRAGLEAKLVRLRAEQAGARDLVFPASLAETGGPVAVEIVTAERRLFRARAEMYDRKLEIHRKSIEQQVAELAAVRALTEAVQRQAEVLDRDLKAIAGLVEKGYAARPRLSELQTRESELVGRAAELAGRKAKAEQAKAAAEIELLALDTEFQRGVAGDLQAAQLELAEVTERMTTASDVLRRIDVVSPQDGVVTNIRMRTPGSVVAPGQPILDIVPQNEPLVVEAKVGLRDVDSLHVGSPVQVRLTAFNARSTPPLSGRLTYVAADQQQEEANGGAFYVARAEISPESLASSPDVRLYPGMPAEVLILNKPRRALDYLLGPIVESFGRAFRED
jgi:HlyD family secretion protein